MTSDPHRNQPVLRLGVPLDEAAGVMILLHGRGGSAEDMFSLGEELGGPDFAYLAPKAANNTWYPYSFLAPLEQNEPYLTSALNRVEAIVRLANDAGLPSKQIVISGFSQGACLATESLPGIRADTRASSLLLAACRPSRFGFESSRGFGGNTCVLGFRRSRSTCSVASRSTVRRSAETNGGGYGDTPVPRYASYRDPRGD